MRDLIYRETARRIIDSPRSKEQMLNVLRYTPSVQPEIIYCRECKYASPNGAYGCRLERFSVHNESVRLFAGDYCSAAERRTDGQAVPE